MREKIKEKALGVCPHSTDGRHRYEISSWVGKDSKVAVQVTCMNCFKTVSLADVSEADSNLE